VNGFLDVSQNLNVRSNMYVNGDVSFNSTGRVDVCGNFYAQYPDNSIPISAIIGDNENKANLDYVDASLNLKADMEATNDAIALKSNLTYVDASLNLKADMEATNDAIALKANLDYVDASLNLKADINNATFTGKSTFTEIVVNDNLTVTQKTTLGDDVSMNANVDISGNLAINGNLSVFKNQSTEIINTTVNEYTSIVTEDISLNGGLSVSGDSSFNSHVTIQDLSANNIDVGQISGSSITTQGTISAQTYSIGGSGVISATKQISCRDIEMKDNAGNITLLSYGDTGNTTIKGELSIDTITETTTDAGVTIESVLLKDGTIGSGGITSSGTISAQTFSIGGSGVISATKQISCRDIEMKDNAGNITLISYGDTGNTTIQGELEVDGDVSFNAGLSVGGALNVTGTVSGPTAASGTNTTQLATTAFVTTAVAAGGVDTDSDLSLNAGLSVGGDVSLNAGLSVGGNITIPDKSINITALKNNNNLADTTYQTFVITASGGKYYIDGILQSTIILYRGLKYSLDVNDGSTGSHPFYIQTTDNGGAYDATNVYNDGITNNGATTGIIDFIVPDNAPDTLYYRCSAHLGMGGIIQLENYLNISDNLILSKNLNVTGTVSGPTAASGTNTTQLATTAFVTTAIADGGGGGVDPDSDLSLNAGLSVGGDVSFNAGFSVNGYLNTLPFVNNIEARKNAFQVGEDIDGEASGDRSGQSVSLSSDGTIVAIGAYFNGGTTSNNYDRRGHVRIYKYRKYTQSDYDAGTYHYTSQIQNTSTQPKPLIITENNTTAPEVDKSYWMQLGGDIDGEATDDRSGQSVSLSSDGTIVAIGAIGFVYGTNNTVGYVRVYQYTNNSWNQLGPDIDGEASGDNSGSSVSLSIDGTIVAIGAYFNDGTTSNNSDRRGHVRIYKYREYTQSDSDAGTYHYTSQIQNTSTQTKPLIITENNTEPDIDKSYWMQLGTDIDGEATSNQSGYSVSLSSDGSIVAIGAPYNVNSNGSGIGHVRVYQYTNSSWMQLGTDIDGESAGDYSGYSVSLSSDGTIVAIGARLNDGNGSTDSGHVRVYQYDSTKTTEDTVESSATFGPVGWNRLGHDIDGEATSDQSGSSVSLSSDGSIVAIGALYNGNSNGSGFGHVRVYQYINKSWRQVGPDIDGEATNDYSGYSVSLSSDGTIVAIGAITNDGTTGNSNDGRGHVRVYSIFEDTYDAVKIPGSLIVTGTLSKGSGTFKIDHPLPEKQDTHNLVHSFIEGPRMDNIYRGHIHLVNGLAEINLDTQFNMTEGTFIALNRDLSVFTTNEDDWDNVRGKVTGNILTIECQNTESTALISYLVIGERQDKHAKETYITDMDGRLITEPLKIRA
jgi:hypothetical protein